MDELRYIALTGCLGNGYSDDQLATGAAMDPHFIGSDAGSTDGGPRHLGGGGWIFGPEACKHDLRHATIHAQARGVPFLVGSSRASGIDDGVDDFAQLVRDIAKEDGLRFKMAKIYNEPDRDFLLDRYKSGRLKPLAGAPPIDEDVFRRSTHIVAMIGTEPFSEALDHGAQVVLAGRASDAAIFSTVPEREGFDKGIVWHAAKILECGSAAIANRRGPDPLFCRLREDHFIVEPLDPEYRCTPASVALHGLHEIADPFHLREPSGTTDTTNVTFEAIDDRRVKVSGATHVEERYTIKLEGAELAGYRSIALASVRDPVILQHLERWLDSVREEIDAHALRNFGANLEYRYQLRTYGANGTLGGLESTPDFEGHEAFLILDVVGSSQDLASTICMMANQVLMHHHVDGWKGVGTTVAHPYSPATFDTGAVYRFNMHHVVEVDDPLELSRIEYEEVGS